MTRSIRSSLRSQLLQMIKRIVPPMSNEIITLVKDTSLARIIALQEIIWAGQAFYERFPGNLRSDLAVVLYSRLLSDLQWCSDRHYLAELEKKLEYFN